MALMILGIIAVAWLVAVLVVIGLCVSAARTDRALARTARTPARGQLRLIA